MSAISLRIWHESPDSTIAVEPSRFTLREAYNEFLLPELIAQKRAGGTLSAYGTALNHWERCTPNPPIGDVADTHAIAFRDAMMDGNALPTVKKNWRHLTVIFRELDRLDHIRKPPRVIIAKPKPKLPRVVSLAEVDKLYETCDVAEWPPKAKTFSRPGKLWRAFLALEFNLGMRTQDAWRLTWEAIDFESNLVRFITIKTAKLQGVPMHEVLRKHLEGIRSSRRNIFWPTMATKQFYAQWAKINQAAGISLPVEWRDLRETCCTRYERIKRGVGGWILGHAARGVTECNYHEPSQEVLDAVQLYEQPGSFTLGVAGDKHQRRLFV